MTTTTIRVSHELRDRLERQPEQDGSTLGAHLARLAGALDRDRRREASRVAIAAASEAATASSRAESDEWERASLTDLREWERRHGGEARW